MAKVRRNHMIAEGQADWIDEMSDEWDVDKSFIIRRAIKFYRGEGHKRDKMLKRKMKGEI